GTVLSSLPTRRSSDLARLYEDDTQDRYFHLYFNPSKHAAERERLELTLDRFKIYMDKHIGDVVISSKACQEYFTLKYDKAGHLRSEEHTSELQSRFDL